MDFISFSLRREAAPEVTPKVVQIFHPKAGKHKETEKKREEMKSGFDEQFSPGSLLEGSQRW